MTRRSPEDTLRAMGKVFLVINAEHDAGAATAGRDIDLLLDVRQLAREALADEPDAGRDALIVSFRLAMAKLELAIDNFIFAQPDSSPEQDQQLFDSIKHWYQQIDPRLDELAAHEPPPLH